MELRHLRYFVATVEERSFQRAAERLHISQPPLSAQVRDLEEELGVQLLERTSKGVVPTPAGEVFYEEAKAILASVQQARRRALGAARGEVGRLAIGFISIVDYSFLPAALKRFRAEVPGVELQLSELTSDAQVDALLADALDLGVGLAPMSHADLVFKPLLREPLVLAAPAGKFPAGARVRLASLAQEAFVMIPRSAAPGYYDLFADFCRSCGFEPRVVQRARQMQTVVSLVSNDFGIALVPESVMGLRRPGVDYLRLEEESPGIEVGIAWRRNSPNEALPRLARILEEEARAWQGDIGELKA